MKKPKEGELYNVKDMKKTTGRRTTVYKVKDMKKTTGRRII